MAPDGIFQFPAHVRAAVLAGTPRLFTAFGTFGCRIVSIVVSHSAHWPRR